MLSLRYRYFKHWLRESTKINEEKGKSRSSKVILSVYNGISKGLERIFRRFKDIRHNSTEN